VALEKPQSRYQRLVLSQSSRPLPTDVPVMNMLNFQTITLFAVLTCLQAAAVETVTAGECRACRGPFGGKTMPREDTGCGPRYWGAFWDEPNCPDPCDCRNQWRGGPFQSPSLDLLAPWQLPPGRGFWSPQQCGYATEGHCHTCGQSWWPHWVKQGWFAD